MKCENCGNEVREGAKFCSKCGSNILEQQEDHSGKHNVHETKTEKRCVNCGNVLREESKFCPKCGSSTLEQKEDVSTLKDEEKDKAEQSKGTFYFEKVKMIGRLRYKIIRTEVSNNEERLEISQKIHRFLRKEKENHLEIKLSEIGSMELKTKMDFWDTLYAALFGVMFLMNITDVAWLLLIAVFLYTGYGKVLNLKMKNGLNFEIPVNGMTEDVEQFRLLMCIRDRFRCRRIYRKILYARIVTARIRFRLLRTRQRLKQKDTVWGAGAVECVCSVRLDYCAERSSRALK